MAGERLPTIELYDDKQHVGTLVFQKPRECQFHYSLLWQEQKGYRLSPHIQPAQPITSETIVNFIRNLFPEGSAFDALLETENLSKNNLYGILKTIGKDTAGAISFHVIDEPHSNEKNLLREISEDELSQRLASGEPLHTWDGKYRLSLAGVQNKLNVFVDSQQKMYLAEGCYASTHILKFASDNYPTIVINELICMRLAKSAGLEVAPAKHKRIGQYGALQVTRFDRKETEKGVKKRHVIDGCQALNLPPEYKYEQQWGKGRDVHHIRDGVSITKLFAFTQQCSVPAKSKLDILDWLLFNLLIGNSDAHGKNISFLIANHNYILAPFYDLVSVTFEAVVNPKLDTDMAMAIDEEFNIDDIHAYQLLGLASEAQLPPRIIEQRLQRMIARCRLALPTLISTEDALTEVETHLAESIKQHITERLDRFKREASQIRSVQKLL